MRIIFESADPGNVFYKLLAQCVNGAAVFVEKEKILLEKKVVIKELRKDGLLVSGLKVFFYPPDPQTDLEGAGEVEVILTFSGNDLAIKINKSGLVNVE